jgi:hypothetical protein
MATIITADSANNISRLQDQINVIVQSQLDIVNQKIMNHNANWGRNVIAVNLQDNFVINKLEKIDAQRIIYSKMIKSLKKRGFDVKIALGKNGGKTTLYVAWKVGYEKEECEQMNKLITDNEIYPNQIENWIDEGANN